MKRFLELKLYELLLFYVGLFTIYVILPQPLYFIRHIIAPVMGVLIVVVFMNSIMSLRSSKSLYSEISQSQPGRAKRQSAK